MALATICPHCSTTFRVAADQLKLRGGIVRCGACNEVFDGNAALIDMAALAAHEAAAALAAPAAEAAAEFPAVAETPEAAAIAASQADEAAQEEPIYTLDFDTTFDPFGILPKSLDAAAQGSDPAGSDPVVSPRIDEKPEPAKTGSVPVFEQQVDEQSITGSLDAARQGSDPAGSDPVVSPRIDEKTGQAKTGSVPVFEQQVDEQSITGSLDAARQGSDPAGSDPVVSPRIDEKPEQAKTGSVPVFEQQVDAQSVARSLDAARQGSDPAGSDPVVSPRIDEEPGQAITGSVPVFEQYIDEEIVALPLPDEDFDDAAETPPPPAPARDESVDFQPPLLMRPSAAAAEPAPPPPSVQTVLGNPPRRVAAKRKKVEPVLAAPPPVAGPPPGEHEPEFVRQIRHKEKTGPTRRIVMGAGSALLALALAAQVVGTFRNVLAARYPQAKPLLVGACAVLGCKVELPAQIDALSVETGELQSLGANTFSFTTLLRNQGDLAQAWPHLELALTDANDKPLVRRVFAPAEYLPPGVAPAKGFAPRSEQPVKLYFELNQLKASGYHIAIFYP